MMGNGPPDKKTAKNANQPFSCCSPGHKAACRLKDTIHIPILIVPAKRTNKLKMGVSPYINHAWRLIAIARLLSIPTDKHGCLMREAGRSLCVKPVGPYACSRTGLRMSGFIIFKTKDE